MKRKKKGKIKKKKKREKKFKLKNQKSDIIWENWKKKTTAKYNHCNR